MTKEEKIVEILQGWEKDNGHYFNSILESDYENIAQEIVKLFAIPDVSQQSELLLAFIKFYHSDAYSPENTTFKEDVEAFLEANNCG